VSDTPRAGEGRPVGYPESFLRAVEQAVAQLGWRMEGWTEGGLAVADERGRGSYGLENLYRRVREADEAEWPELIANHLARVEAGMARAKADEDLHSVAHRLLVRISRPFDSAELAEKVWWQPLGSAGVVAVLVVDRPETMSYVTRDMVEESGRAGAEWLEVALDNLRNRTSPEMLEPIGEDTAVQLCCTGDAYDAARALVLDRLLPEAEHGALIAVPNRDRLLVLPLEPAALGQVHLLKAVAVQSFREAPYPVSEEVIWTDGQEWHRIDVELRDGTLRLGMPNELADVLRGLMGGAEED
jgi:hypothetical protein